MLDCAACGGWGEWLARNFSRMVRCPACGGLGMVRGLWFWAEDFDE